MADVLRFPRPETASDAARLDELRSLLASVTTTGSLPVALDALVRWVERTTTALCSVSLVDVARGELVHGAAPSLPRAFNAAAHGLPIADGVGSCGSAAATRVPVYVSDIATDWHWAPYRHIAAEHGLAACWSQPILSASGDVLGTFALYHRAPATPSPDERALMHDAARVAALVIERARTEEARRQAEIARHEAALRMRRVADAVNDILLLVDVPEGIIRFANAAAAHRVAGGVPLEGQTLSAAQLTEWTHPDDVARAVTFTRDVLAGGAPAPIELRQRLPDGSIRWMHCRHVVIGNDAAGRPTRVLFIGSDITAERALGWSASAEPPPGPDASSTDPGRAKAQADDPMVARLRTRRILVVDDEPDVVRVVVKRLQRAGCEVDTAVDGEVALERLLAAPQHWHLILTDQTMPRRTGEQLLLAMREHGIATPVVVMSGYSATVTPDRMLSIGAAAFLPKPFDGAQLLATLAGALGG